MPSASALPCSELMSSVPFHLSAAHRGTDRLLFTRRGDSRLLWLLLVELETGRVDAVALAGRVRAVVENMPQMAPAAAAEHLDAVHAVAEVVARLDGALVRDIPEARPAA